MDPAMGVVMMTMLSLRTVDPLMMKFTFSTHKDYHTILVVMVMMMVIPGVSGDRADSQSWAA